jgi:hypothetical protein
MTELEGRLRQELQNMAQRIAPADPRPLRQPPARSSRGAVRWLAPLAAAVAVACVAGGLELASRSGRPPHTQVTSPQAADPPVFAGISNRPARSEREWLALYSVTNGRMVRSLGRTFLTDGFALSPDAKSVFISGNSPDIRRVSAVTGASAVVAHGAYPAVSPDSRYLAYATSGRINGIGVLDLRTGRTRTIDLAPLIGAGSIFDGGLVTWLGDGTQIVTAPVQMPVVQAYRSPARSAGSGRTATDACGQQTSPRGLCLIVIDTSRARLSAHRVYVPASALLRRAAGPGGHGPGQAIAYLTATMRMVGDASRAMTVLISHADRAGTGSRTVIDAVRLDGSRARTRRIAVLPRTAYLKAIAPGGDRILYVGGNPSGLWTATLTGGRLARPRRLMTARIGCCQIAW